MPKNVQLALLRKQAHEHHRRLMQGLGRPIISHESNGVRIVAIGSRIKSSRNWVTFHDFLMDYIQELFGRDWARIELAKPAPEAHPLIQWHRRVVEYRDQHRRGQSAKIVSAPMTGMLRAFYGLAYDLYLAAHNAELPELVLKRLKNAKTFEAALYEAFVCGCFARAGFEIEFEDEADSTVTHCEFVVKHKETGRCFSVEAKSVDSSSTRAGRSSKPPKIRGQLHRALSKAAAYPRVVFIELNRAGADAGAAIPDWVEMIDKEVAECESELTIDKLPAPSAYVIVTNRSFLHALDELDSPFPVFPRGFKIVDFPAGRGVHSILGAVDAREKHREIHWLLKAVAANSEIPSTFDGRAPEEVFSTDGVMPLQVGQTYIVPTQSGHEVPGVLVGGVVLASSRVAYCTYELGSGEKIISTVPLTEQELSRYQRSPETFFGVVQHVGRELTSALDMFDFFYDSYSQTPKERLLEFMANWGAEWSSSVFTQKELAKRYAAGMAQQMWADRQRSLEAKASAAKSN